MKRTSLYAICTGLLILGASFSSAAQITVLSLIGNWHDASYTSTTSGVGTITNGDPTSSINWGGTVAVSGYDFTKSVPGAQTLPPAPTPLFPLGTFVHRNQDLGVNGNGSRTLKSVFLDVVTTLNVDGNTVGPLTFTFKFNHDETSNTSTMAQCDQSKVNPGSTVPCPDVVTFAASPSPTTFNVGGVNYTLSMSFVNPNNGALVNKFITEEHQSNTADLVGQFNTPATGGGTNQAPIPNAGPDQTLPFGQPGTLTGSATDDGLPNNIMTVSWTKISGPGLVNFGNTQALQTSVDFSAAGSYVLRLTANDTLLTASDDVTIQVNNVTGCNPDNTCAANTCSTTTCQDSCGDIYQGTKTCTATTPVVTKVIVSPANATIKVGASQSFVAIVLDQFGKLMPSEAVTWSATSGSINNSGVFTSNTSGQATIRATSVTNISISGTAQISVEAPVPTSVEVTPKDATIHIGDSKPLTAVVKDQFSQVMPNETVTWGASVGNISNAGSFSSATPFNNVTVTAKSTTKPTVSGTATLHVLAKGANFVGDISAAKGYPVPWKSGMTPRLITFSGVAPSTTLRIFTATGQQVQSLTQVVTTSSGYEMHWDMTNSNGELVASGVYFYLLDNSDSDQHLKGKLLIIK